jgi:multiple sugar transport system ATP-binding protein
MTATGLRDVTARRGGTVALTGVTLLAEQGELVAVLGPSGCGKSTVLRVIAGLEPVERGDVLVAGQPVTALPPGRRGVSMVFESTSLVPFMDVARNLGWGLRANRVPEAEISARVTDRARQLRFSGLLPRRPATLSEGERSLVGIGRALVRAPEAFLLDEPLAHLDGAGRLRVRREIVSVVRTLGVTTFWVTHDQSEALSVADRVALLDAGALVQLGTPTDLYERPVDLVAAGFVGSPSIGLLPARLVVSAGQAGFVVGPRTLPLWGPVPAALAAQAGRDVVLGFRPEDVRDGSGGADPAAVVLTGVATTVEYTGRRTEVAAAIGAPPVTAPGAAVAGGDAGATLRAFFSPAARVRRGDEVRLAVKAARAHVFDAGTGRALHHPDQ